MHDQRRHPRTAFESEVRVTHPSFGTAVMTMRDFSDGGMFIYTTENMNLPPVGSVIEVQALVFGDQAPVLRAKIVRTTDQGVGLMFCQMESA